MDTLKYIEKLRDELNIIVDDIESCDKDKLLEVSQKLDRVILEYIQELDKEKS